VKSVNKRQFNSGVYVITNLVNGRRYFGSSCRIRQRWARHKAELRAGIHSNPRIQRAWNKYGEASFAFKVVCWLKKDDLLWMEQRFIDSNDGGYNMGPARAVMLGRKFTAEHVAKIQAGRAGFRHSDESKTKISNAQLGRKLTDEHKDKVRKSITGQVRSFASRQKMSAVRKGRAPTFLGKRHTKATKAAIGIASHETKLRKKVWRYLAHDPPVPRWISLDKYTAN
jgi:group I intron endonuclease